MGHDYQDLIAIFNQTFFDQFNTKLELGGDEPIYLPADDKVPHHRIIFARGFYASGMHEIAHWCVAGFSLPRTLRKPMDNSYLSNQARDSSG